MSLTEHLRNGQQCDEDGVMCIVSRQACHEAADEIERMRAAISGIAPWLSASLDELDAGPEYIAACNAVFECDHANTMEP